MQTEAKLNYSLPYKVYVALLTQSGTSAPTVTILENTIGTINWTYGGVGTSIATASVSGAFTANKTWMHVQNTNGGTYSGTAFAPSFGAPTTSLVLITFDTLTGNPQNGILSSSSVEIRVYN